MKITAKLIRNRNFVFDASTTIFLMICSLHKSGVISDVKLTGMLKSFRNGTFVKLRGTYKWKDNEGVIWFNDESMLEIMQYVFEKRKQSEVDFESLLKYVNLLTGKKRSICVTWVVEHIIEPVVQRYKNNPEDYNLEYVKEILTEMDLSRPLNMTKFDDYDVSYSYCCEDCDGPYHDFKWNRYKYYVLPHNEKVIDEAIAKLYKHEKAKKE